jgi:precorrin-2/cobalt-factor-2 C20-methyltransferase
MNAQDPYIARNNVGVAALGVLYGVGLGPGDPELVTVKAARLIGEAKLVAYFAKRGRPSNARAIAQIYLTSDCEELLLAYPVTTEIPCDSPDYVRALSHFYEESALRIADHLTHGRDVALLCEGDPMFYGSFMHIFARLDGRFRVEMCAGVSGMSGCFAAARQPMTWGDDVLTVLPATLSEQELADRLLATDAAVVMKLGGNFPKLRRAIMQAGLLDRAIYIERGTMAGEKIMPLRDKGDDDAPYFAMVLVPGRGRRP